MYKVPRTEKFSVVRHLNRYLGFVVAALVLVIGLVNVPHGGGGGGWEWVMQRGRGCMSAQKSLMSVILNIQLIQSSMSNFACKVQSTCLFNHICFLMS